VRKADSLSPSCAVVTKSGSLNFLEPSGPVQACNGTALPLQNMKLVTNTFKSGGLHEKHVVATWNLGNHLSICLQTQENQEKPVSTWPVAGPSEY